MLAGERELTQRFAVYGDEELLRILTAERAKYRPEALAAAETVLTRRGMAPPAAPQPGVASWPPKAEPTAVPARGRPKSPYQPIDLLFDALLFGLVFWALKKLAGWTTTPGHVWGTVAYLVLLVALMKSAGSLRVRWRAMKWRD